MQDAKVYSDTMKTLEVTAPTDMASGYEFMAEAGDGHQYKVRVPEGGVSSGQRFDATVVEQAAGGSHNVPQGRWRDRLCDCCSMYCTFHCCVGFWFPSVLLGQVLTRLRLNWLATPKQAAISAFKVLAGITVLWYIGAAAYQAVYYEYGKTTSSAYSDSFAYGEHTATLGLENASAGMWVIYIISSIITYGIAILLILVTCRTRQHIRERYNIPAAFSLEDLCCGVFCAPCAICQMARHTADYETHPASCCTETGLGAGAPSVV